MLNVQVEELGCSEWGGVEKQVNNNPYESLSVLHMKKMENVRLENIGGVLVRMGVGMEFRWSEKTL